MSKETENEMSRSEIWALVVVILSLIAVILSSLYFPALEWVRVLFSFIAGVSSTIFAQERLENKKRKRAFEIYMTKKLYGPLLNELNLMLEDIGRFGLPIDDNLKDIVEDWRFVLVDKELRNRIKGFLSRLPRYTAVWNEARRETETYIMKRLGKNEIEFGSVRFNFFGGNVQFSTNLMEPIWMDKTPLDFLSEKARGYQDYFIAVYVRGKSQGALSTKHKMHKISVDILDDIRKDPKVNEQRSERESLIEECNSIMEPIKEKIVL